MTQPVKKKENNVSNGTHLANYDLDAIFNNITDLISLCDSDYKIIRSNRSADLVLGGGKTVAGSHCYEQYRGNSQPCKDCPLSQTISNDFIVSLEYYDKRFGEYFEERAHPITSENGELKGFILIGRNITKSRELRERGVHDKVSSGIAHDFKNMLTGILGSARLARKRTSDRDILQHLQLIETAALSRSA